jgi:hypothetical protein
MARTKKYLTGSSASKKRGFYRPIKRLKESSKKHEFSLHSNVVINKEPKIETVNEIKMDLDKKIEKTPKLIKPVKINEEKLAEITKKQLPKPLKKLIKKPLISKNKVDELPKESEENLLNNNLLSGKAEDRIDFSSHDENEKVTLLKKRLEFAEENEIKFKKELKQIEDSFSSERDKLEDTIKSLRKELHRTDPIDHNKFFSISKELQEVVSAMDQLIESEGLSFEDSNNGTQNSIPATASATAAALKPFVSNPNQTITDIPKVVQNLPVPVDTKEKEENEIKKKKGLFSKIPKGVKILTLTLTLVGIIAGGIWHNLTKKTEVDSQLIQQYLPEGSQTPTDSTPPSNNKTSEDPKPKEEQNNQPETKGASDEKYTESQANVAFSETKWDTLKVPNLGIEINYPKNAVNIIKTDSSITFIRKTGYIFKIQIIETALSVSEYWKLIKSSNLNYKVKETNFRDREALFLELEDFSDYPGDKYLVKNGKYIFDIWYATYSNNLSDDDAKRIEIMLNSFKFLD